MPPQWWWVLIAILIEVNMSINSNGIDDCIRADAVLVDNVMYNSSVECADHSRMENRGELHLNLGSSCQKLAVWSLNFRQPEVLVRPWPGLRLVVAD